MTFFQSFKSLWGAVAIVVATGPLGMIAPNLHPPWPTGSGTIAFIVSACGLIIAYARTRTEKSVLKIESIGFVVVGVLVLLCYLVLYSQFVLVEPQSTVNGQNDLRFVIGYEYLPGGFDIADIDRLRNVSYQVDQVWTRKSITIIRLSMMVSFSLSFALIAYGSSILAIGTREHSKTGLNSHKLPL